jgi:group I intron endonuclease
MYKSGIYIISSIQFPDRHYVGSSVDLKQRRARHFRELTAGNHCNQKLQRHVLNYGIEDLRFDIIYYCIPADLLKFEQNLINQLRPYFNICPVAGSRLGSVQSKAAKMKIKRSWLSRPSIPIHSRLFQKKQ